MFTFNFIRNISNKHPALGRIIEIALISAITYSLGAVVNGEVFNMHALIIAIATPFYAGLTKRKRDIENLK